MARVVLHGIALSRVVANRVVREHLAVGQQRNVDADDRPVHDRAPLAPILGSARNRGRSRFRVGARDDSRVRIERALLRDRVHDSILGRVASG